MPEKKQTRLSQISPDEYLQDLQHIYKTCFPLIKNYVLKNSGTIEDAKDIFQDTLMAFYIKSASDNFMLSSDLSTYLFSIARHQWLKKLRAQKKFIDNDLMETAGGNSFEDDDLKIQLQLLFTKCFAQLGEQCKHILTLYFEEVPGEEITKRLNFKSYEYFRTAKTRCIKKLKALMQKDRIFKDLK